VKHFVAIGGTSYHTWRMRLISTLLVFASAACLPAQAAAFDLEQELREQHVQYQEVAEHRVTQSDGMTLAQATESVRSRTGGQILSAETRVSGGREVHHIKVLKDGKVKTYKVNGRKR
jgi:uncharacterized membrane protein YkoI